MGFVGVLVGDLKGCAVLVGVKVWDESGKSPQPDDPEPFAAPSSARLLPSVMLPPPDRTDVRSALKLRLDERVVEDSGLAPALLFAARPVPGLREGET